MYIILWSTLNFFQGRIQDCHLGRGAQKIMWAQAHYKREIEVPFGLRALEALGLF